MENVPIPPQAPAEAPRRPHRKRLRAAERCSAETVAPVRGRGAAGRRIRCPVVGQRSRGSAADTGRVPAASFKAKRESDVTQGADVGTDRTRTAFAASDQRGGDSLGQRLLTVRTNRLTTDAIPGTARGIAAATGLSWIDSVLGEPAQGIHALPLRVQSGESSLLLSSASTALLPQRFRVNGNLRRITAPLRTTCASRH